MKGLDEVAVIKPNKQRSDRCQSQKKKSELRFQRATDIVVMQRHPRQPSRAERPLQIKDDLLSSSV